MSEITSQNESKLELQQKPITYNEIAIKLLSDKLLLTALELHTELIESGRELKQLKDFFSNPGNFEFQTQEVSSRISRSGSQVTLDSLDLTRFSEDGAGTDEKVTVLEFELRKARETINALRNNLTVAIESEASTPVKGSSNNFNVGGIKPHEQRALNFLINEYLLLHGYKLTSITFADENQNQDFDDWDDVGLNISKPPELLTIYRDGLRQTGQNCVSVSTQTAEPETEILKREISDLKLKYNHLANDYSDLKSANANLHQENALLASQVTVDDAKVATPTSKGGSLGSESPERFEIIDKNIAIFKKRDSIITLDDNISNNSFNTSEWTNLSMNLHDNEKNEIISAPGNNVIKIPNMDLINDEPFKREVFSLCYVNIPHKVDNEILDNILNNSVTKDSLIHVLSQSLLKIIPSIILNKREDALPLLIGAVILNPSSSERDKLLQQLFNLKKKPSDTERMMILTGIVGIARFSGESLVENEILPQCWEQLTDKYVERRLLVVEACIALIPYVSSPIRNSLILSILQQMLDDREESVREAVIRALSLEIALCDDSNKYVQCEELVLNTLNDSSPSIIHLSSQILFPVLGQWALKNQRLRGSLMKHLLHNLNEYLKDTDVNKSKQTHDKILRVVSVLENLLPFLLVLAANQSSILCNIEKDMAIELNSDFKKLCSNLTNPTKFFKSDTNVGMMLYEFDKYIASNPKKSWEELDWILDMMIPDLLNNLNHVEINQHLLLQSFINLFSHITIIFGRNFAKYKISPIFQAQIQNLEQILSNFNQFCPSLNIIPVYLVAILSYCDKKELVNVLKRFLCALPLCGTPLDCLEVTIKGLCELDLQELVVASLWEGVVHQRPLVRAASATLFSSIISLCGDNLLSAKVTPALVTLASDNDLLVKTASIPALGCLITDCNVKEVHDKANMQIQTYIADTSLRENHTLLRQLIVTLGSIVNSCSPSFKQEVILPHLSSLSSYMMQMSNQTRKVDMALALIEAFTNVVYSPLNKQSISSVVLPGLKCLEIVVNENQQLSSYRDTVQSIIKECDNKIDSPVSPNVDKSNKLSHNVNHGIEEMRQRVSKIFHKPAVGSKSNIQSIFKK